MRPTDTGFLNSASNKAKIKVLTLDSFFPSFPALSNHEENARRFKTFLYVEDGQAPFAGACRKACNTAHECFTLKSTLFHRESAFQTTNKEYSLAVESAERRTLQEEYRNALAVSQIKGFPKVYGMGEAENEPVIVFEHIEGITLSEAFNLMPSLNPAANAMNPSLVCSIGKAVLKVLLNTKCLEEKFLHRDISPTNILIRTNRKSLSQQIRENTLDIVLVDFGSSSYGSAALPYATAKYGIWRFGTAEYAAPEMLTQDVEGIEALRYSETIDTYALCSVLYQLLTGKTPFHLAARIGESPYLIKKNSAHLQPEIGHGKDPAKTALLGLAEEGIKPEQKDRYTLGRMYALLTKWEETYPQPNAAKKCPPPED